jgi:hypothetical protein
LLEAACSISIEEAGATASQLILQALQRSQHRRLPRQGRDFATEQQLAQCGNYSVLLFGSEWM